MSGESLPGDHAFFQSIASGWFHVVIFEVSRADCKPERYALSFVFGKLPSRFHILTSVQFYRSSRLFQLIHDRLGILQQTVPLLITTINRNNRDLRWSQFWRKNQSVVV